MQPQDFQRYLRRTVVIPVILLGVLTVVLLWQINYTVQALRQVDYADQVISDGHLLMRLSLDMESGLRGYLLTGNETFLQPYYAAQKLQPATEKELQQLVGNNPAQQYVLQQARLHTADWFQYANAMLQARRTGANYTDVDLNLEGKRLMDEIRDERRRFVQDAERMREQRSKAARRATRTVLATLGLLAASIAVILVLVTRSRMIAISDSYTRHVMAERERGEEARSNREWLLTTLRSIGDSVIATDPDGRIEFLNTAAEKLTGWKEQEARGKPITEILRTFDERSGLPIADPANFVRTRHNAANSNLTLVLERKDGERRTIDENGAPILDINGQLRGIVLVLRDMTERRKSETVLRSSERLALVGRLSATIAHEIRNPLDAVTNLLYLIRSHERLPEAVREYSGMAQEEVRRITQITSQLLSFNREAREPVKVNLCEIMDTVLALFQPKLVSSGMTVTKDYETTENVIGFPGELRQVLSNLVANAMEAGEKGGRIRIRISGAVDWRDHLRRGVRVMVSDDGGGIPLEARAGLFTPFFTTKGEKGTGLGLWVSRGIIEKHQGSLRFRSATEGPNRGTSFSVFLPILPSSTASSGTAA